MGKGDGGNYRDLIASVTFSGGNYQRLGTTREQRCAAYRAITMETLSNEDIQAIRLHLQRQHALGSDRFRSAIEAQLARSVGPLRIGRPRKMPTD
jgi:putative transposase